MSRRGDQQLKVLERCDAASRSTSSKQGITPGPWRAEIQEYFSPARVDVQICASEQDKWDRGRPVICTMNYENENHVREANAKAIAAVPDLLAKLRELYDYFDSAPNAGTELARHILALETDPYLQGHPEWEAFLNEAQALVKQGERDAMRKMAEITEVLGKAGVL